MLVKTTLQVKVRPTRILPAEPLGITRPRRVVFPLFEISSNPEIPLTQIRERRFDLIERAQTLARTEIDAADDARVFGALDDIARDGFSGLQLSIPEPEIESGQRWPSAPVVLDSGFRSQRGFSGVDIRAVIEGATPPATTVTTVRPDSSVSLVSGEAAGIEPVYRSGYMREVRQRGQVVVAQDFSQLEMRIAARTEWDRLSNARTEPVFDAAQFRSAAQQVAQQHMVPARIVMNEGDYNDLVSFSDPEFNEQMRDAYVGRNPAHISIDELAHFDSSTGVVTLSAPQIAGTITRIILYEDGYANTTRSGVRHSGPLNRAQRRARLSDQKSQRYRGRVPTPPRWHSHVPASVRERQTQARGRVRESGVRLHSRGGRVRNRHTNSRNRRGS